MLERNRNLEDAFVPADGETFLQNPDGWRENRKHIQAELFRLDKEISDKLEEYKELLSSQEARILQAIKDLKGDVKERVDAVVADQKEANIRHFELAGTVKNQMGRVAGAAAVVVIVISIIMFVIERAMTLLSASG